MSEPAPPPRIAAIVLNHDGASLLEECLPSLKAQDAAGHGIDLEIVVADNGSSDGSRVVAERHGVRFLPLGANLGFSGGNNAAARAADGDYLLFVNNDMRFERDFVSRLADALAARPDAFAADARQLDWDGTRRVHGANRLRRARTLDGFLPGLAIEQDDRAGEVPWGSGANLLVRRDRFLALGGFHEALRWDLEDADLCWRAWLRGWPTVHVPGAVARHRVGASFRDPRARRDRWRSQAGNQVRVAVRLLPAGRAALAVARAVARVPVTFLSRGGAEGAARAGGVAGALVGLPGEFRARREIRVTSAIPRAELLRRFLSDGTARPSPAGGRRPARDPTVGVIVPTRCRPDDLRTCLDSLAAQDRPPDAVVVVLPEEETSCDDVVAEFTGRLPLRVERSGPGIVRAVNRGLAGLGTDVAVLLDDDAHAPPGWLRRVSAWFRDPTVGAAGGPIVPDGRSPSEIPAVRRWDRFHPLGYGDVRPGRRPIRPQTAHFLMEANLAFRRDVLTRVDARLRGRDQRFGDDVTFSVLRAGLRVVADPEAWVWHADRRIAEGGRPWVPGAGQVRAIAHNQTYLWLKHLRPGRRIPFLLYGTVAGDRSVKGLLAFAGWALRNAGDPRRARAVLRLVGPTLRGRVDGVRTYLAARR